MTIERNKLIDLAHIVEVGHLGIVTGDGYPRVIPINFALLNGAIYFHGAKRDEKYEAFTAGQKVTFSLDFAYSLIPSYWRRGDQACAAAQPYRAALIRGLGSIVENNGEKVAALTALMNKYQPEGKFRTLEVDNPTDQKMLAGFAIFCVKPQQVDFKEGLCKNWPAEERDQVVKLLRERGQPLDLVTADEIDRVAQSGDEA